MAPTNKAKAAGVSASSFLDLKAELAKQESEFKKKGSRSTGGEKKEKGTIWARTNKGVAARNARDIEALAADRKTSESARIALERKAAIYDKLKKGKTGGLTDAQYDALLVDFDSKPTDDNFSSDSDDADESLTVPRAPDDEDDPLIEYEDEFGRARTARRSEVPRHLMPSNEKEADDDDPFVIHNPVNHFPVFEPSAERVAAIKQAASEEANPLAAHYDASRENRAKGAAFYNFSLDEETRMREMEELKRARDETEASRRAAGAVDIRPGEGEGLAGDAGDVAKDEVGSIKSRASEKRKREIEERRALIEAKRKKKTNGAVSSAREVPTQDNETPRPSDPLASLELQLRKGVNEEKGKEKHKSRWDMGTNTKDSTSVADDFLAQLEQDLNSHGK